MSPSADDRFVHLAALRPARRREPAGARGAAAELPNEADRLAQLVGALRRRNHFGEHLQVRTWYAQPQACAPDHRALRLLLPTASGQAPDVSGEFADAEQWLFLDVETTGLAGGTGTYAFLVGVAWWDAGGLQIEQLFMRDHSEEHSLLLALAQRLAERRVLVTFNGKSFDWPLLETRFRMTRAITPAAPRAHLDLLHPARQLWRLRLGSVRLQELERHVLAPVSAGLDWDRARDIPSELIPRTYFDFLRGGSAEPLADVFRHNQMDLRGLAALAGRLLALLADPEASEEDSLGLYGLSRLLRRRGEAARARRFYERALHAGLPAAIDRAARCELAALAKRDRDFERATALWQELIHGAPARPRDAAEPDRLRAALDSFEQLAIYYEHYARAPQRAEALTREALSELRGAFRAGHIEPARFRKLRAQLEHRLARLARRNERQGSGSPGSSARERLFNLALPESRARVGESNKF